MVRTQKPPSQSGGGIESALTKISSRIKEPNVIPAAGS
jgi:hypothetical protein